MIVSHTEEGAKDPRDQGPVPRTQGTKYLLATEEAPAPVPVEPEPVPVQNPAVIAPADAGHARGAAGKPPAREDEDRLATESGGDFGLVCKYELAVLLTEVAVHLRGPVGHRLAADGRLAIAEVREVLVGAVAEGHEGTDGRASGHDHFGNLAGETLLTDDPSQVVVVASAADDRISDGFEDLEGNAEGREELTLFASHVFLSNHWFTSHSTLIEPKAYQLRPLFPGLLSNFIKKT